MSHELHFSCAITYCTFNLSGIKGRGLTVTTKVIIAQYNTFSTVVAMLPWDLTVVVANGWWWRRSRRGTTIQVEGGEGLPTDITLRLPEAEGGEGRRWREQ